ncbi:MAG: ABC transporter ATP-binding protein [Ruminococcaceae bacterium]|nr:ABC transporter ATP-binding protein [Oscillospiraceae bacterium]
MTFREHMAMAKRAFSWQLRYERKYTLYLIVHTLLTAGKSYIPLYFAAEIIDTLVAGEPWQTVAMYVVLTVGLTFLVNAVADWIAPRMNAELNRTYHLENWRYSEKAMDMAYESIEDREVEILRERTRQESQVGYNRFYLHRTTSAVISTVTQIVLSIAMTLSFFFNPAVAPWIKLTFALLLAVNVTMEIICTARSQKLTNAFWDSFIYVNIFEEKYNGYINNYTTGKDLRLYDMGDGIIENFEANDRDVYTRGRKLGKGLVRENWAMVVMSEVLKFVTNFLLVAAALSGAVSVGSISKYVSSIVKMLTAVSKLVKDTQLAFNNHEYLARYFAYFDIPNNMYQGTLTVEKRDDVEYDVEFRDVSFKYPGSDTYALRHVSLKFKVGEKLAVVGLNGSGKTTFIKLLCRLYDPTEGVILLNGVDIRKYDYKEYMSIFSVVFQDFRLFAFSLGQNVAASTDYDPERVKMCLEKAGLEERLDAMPKGLETCLYRDFDPEGVEISGGEAQKVALARALYKNAPFIILDEPTAALDPVAEYEIYSRFNRIVGERTTVYISHRLASCRFCDNILVFDAGQIVQQGSHEALIGDESGRYHALWHAQAQYYV